MQVTVHEPSGSSWLWRIRNNFIFSGFQPPLNNKTRNFGGKAACFGIQHTAHRTLLSWITEKTQRWRCAHCGQMSIVICVENYWQVWIRVWWVCFGILSARRAQIVHSSRGRVSGEPNLLAISILIVGGIFINSWLYKWILEDPCGKWESQLTLRLPN
jgi:hypothetical protein